MGGIDHCADAVAADPFDALTNQVGVAFHNDPMTFGPQIAVIGSAFRGIAGAQVFIVGDTIFIICLCRLMLLQLILIVLLLLLILLLLGLILGVIGGGRTLRRGRRLTVSGGDLAVEVVCLGLFLRRGMGGGHAIGIHPVTAGRGIAALGAGRRGNQKCRQGKAAGSGQKAKFHGATLLWARAKNVQNRRQFRPASLASTELRFSRPRPRCNRAALLLRSPFRQYAF